MFFKLAQIFPYFPTKSSLNIFQLPVFKKMLMKVRSFIKEKIELLNFCLILSSPDETVKYTPFSQSWVVTKGDQI